MQKDRPSLSAAAVKAAKIGSLVFLGLLILVPIVHFSFRATLVFLALVTFGFSLLAAIVAIASAKDRAEKKKALRALGVVGLSLLITVLAALLVLSIVGFA